jgi:Ca-activated chloride channel family protein
MSIRSTRHTGPLGLVLLALVALFAAPPRAEAGGLLVADGGLGGRLEILSHDVDVTVNNGIAVTHTEQVFRNTEDRVVEALYVFPVPKGASVADFSMWINGREMTGEVLEKERAREIYESYKRTRVDPGLLEQVDYRTFEMRIWPIAAGAEQRVKVTYYQELDVDHDTATYVYPLATTTVDDRADTTVQGRFSFNFQGRAAVPVTGLESPSHPNDFVINQPSANAVTASMELAGGSLAEDVVLHLTAERPMTGVDVIANKTGKEDGFFQLTLTAGEELEEAFDSGMDYVFILDVSGSMREDRKLQISTDAAAKFVEALGEKDRFEILTFNSGLASLFNELTTADAASFAAAERFLADQRAGGGTRLRPAFEAAYRYATDADRQLNVVILSDGLSEQASTAELTQLINQRPNSARVFCIGVGNDVNRPLLEQIADRSGGLAAFVSPQDDLGRAAAAFRRKLVRPVATDLSITVSGETYDVTPGEMPDLFHGSPVRLYGRYVDGGRTKVTLSANVMGRDVTRSITVDLPDQSDANPEIERMWAWHRIDELLKKDDRAGSRSAATIAEIVRLGEGFSIVTEYTSFIVLENDAEYQRWNIERRNALRIERDRAAQAEVRREFERLREKAAADVGPAPQREAEPLARSIEPTPGVPSQPRVEPQARDSGDLDFRPVRNRNRGGGNGGGAIDPIAGASLLLTGLIGLAWGRGHLRTGGRDGGRR